MLKHNHCYLPICRCIFVDYGWIGGDRGGNQRSISSSIRNHPYIMSAKGLGGWVLKRASFWWRSVLFYPDIVGGSEKVKKCADVLYGWYLMEMWLPTKLINEGLFPNSEASLSIMVRPKRLLSTKITEGYR